MATGLMPAVLIVMMLLSTHAYADNPGQLGIKLVPGKIIENSEGLIQVYSKSDGGMVDKLIATSSDPSIIQITGIDQDKSHTMSTVIIKALKSGEAKVSLAAPGYSSEEFTIDVSKNSKMASKILIKTTPSTFNTDGPKHGYFSVETTNADDFPNVVQSDLSVSVSTSDPNVVQLQTNQIVIKNGTYYAVGEFDINQPGTAQISASTSSMQTVSTSITVNDVNSEKSIQVYVYPQKINVFSAANAYAVIQLHDSSGIPILAKEDIPITITVHDVNTNLNNTSGQTPFIQVNEIPVIKKGSYWAYVPVEIIAGSNDTFQINAYAKGYSTSGTAAQLTTIQGNMVFGDNSAKMDALPILATGKKELIGIAHLEDSSGNILLAKEDMKIRIDSSSPATISARDVDLHYGAQSAPIFAQVGTVVNPVTLNVVSEVPQAIVPTLTSPTIDSLSLVAEPLISQILIHTSFPLAIFMENGNVLSSFQSDFNALIAPTDVIQTGSLSVSKNSPIQVVNSTLQNDGKQTFSLSGSTYSNTFTLEGLSSYPKSVMMDYPESIIANTGDIFSIELLDGQGIPVYPDHDVVVKLVSNDPSIIDVPDSIIVKKGTYYTTFDIRAKKSGSDQISILVEKIPLSKFDISVISFAPTISITSPDFSETDRPFVATLTTTYKEKPLEGLDVNWKVDGATIQNMSSITNSDGVAKITIIPTNAGTVHVDATVSGGSYGNETVTKDIIVNPPLNSQNSTAGTQSSSSASFSIMGISPVLLILPIVAAGIGILVLKKREMLNEMMEKIGLGEKISEIKEKITNLRQHD